MKYIFMAVAFASTVLTPSTHAQSINFAGLSTTINFNTVTSSTEFKNGILALKIGDSSQTAGLQAAYGLAVGSHILLSVGAAFGLEQQKLAKLALGANNLEFKGKNFYALYLEPAYALNATTLAYGKLSSLGFQAEVSGTSASGSKDFSGIGYAVGIRTLLDRNLFLQVEMSQSNYDEQKVSGIALKPSATTGSLGVGYRF